MKAAIFHLSSRRLSCLLACLAAGMVTPEVKSQDATNIIPTIQMQNVPLTDAIRNLAVQSGRNIILDPRLSSPWVGPDNKPGREPTVTVRWENLSAEEALGKLLKEHGLAMVANPATSIARIAFTNQSVKPLPASAVGSSGTNAVLPAITLDMVPLDEAVRVLAVQAQLRVAVGLAGAPSMVSVRWKNVTARQALAALLDNYGLVLVEDAASGSAKVTPKPAAEK
jgi:hypothetical protein